MLLARILSQRLSRELGPKKYHTYVFCMWPTAVAAAARSGTGTVFACRVCRVRVLRWYTTDVCAHCHGWSTLFPRLGLYRNRC